LSFSAKRRFFFPLLIPLSHPSSRPSFRRGCFVCNPSPFVPTPTPFGGGGGGGVATHGVACFPSPPQRGQRGWGCRRSNPSPFPSPKGGGDKGVASHGGGMRSSKGVAVLRKHGGGVAGKRKQGFGMGRG
jgi:hypothetical protein